MSDAAPPPDDETEAPTADAGEQAAAAEGVPERPTLASGVELSGEMQDSAFEDRPWLIVRDGAYVRVTELLYRVAEAIDGRRSTAEIAKVVSGATGRRVSAENVRQLIGERLIPRGLVVKADGSVAEVRGSGPSRSPLQIGMRTAQIPGRVLDPLAHAFKILFSPLLLLAIVLLGLAAIGWVFLAHGMGEGFRRAVYEPWLILALLPIVIASAAFHEFGHAAALTYGGGRVRGMGAGIYAAYPVFFTDVTDNYRLSRWARVRTDLGGFHFNLVFAIAIVAAYLVTGLDFLLLTVLVIVFSIVQQSIPVVRLDGYWALADITGIPDPLGYVKPFVKSLVPIPAWRDERPPPMKTWVKAVFLIWMAIAVPILIVLTVFMLASVPRVLGTAVDSLRTHLGGLTEAAGRGDATTTLAAVVSIALLVLTSVAFAWFVFKVLKSAFGRLWRWAGESGRRRAVAAATTLAVVAGLFFLWAPPLPFNGNQPGPFHDFRPLVAGERLTVAEALGLAASAAGDGSGSGGGAPPADGGSPDRPATNPAPDLPGDEDVPAVDPPDAEVPPVEPPEVEVPPAEVPEVEQPSVDVPPVPDPGDAVPDVPDVPVP